MDTIFAVSSGRPPAAIAVLRISGPAALIVAEQLAGTLPPPRRASVRRIRSADGETIDQALVLVFLGPKSATGEDLVEFHLHGGRAVVAAAERALAVLPGTRPAAAGEFTRRALANGRIDLIQAQGLADLLEAETEQQRRIAIDSAEGIVSRMVAQWLTSISTIAALIEATIDFDDEDDVEEADTSHIDDLTQRLIADLDAVLDRAPVERYRDGIRIVLVGPPNAGKSSLLNALIGRDAAIVSPVAGTTRDRIEVSVVRRGRAYTLVDTAGLRDDAADPVERVGIERARAALAAADIVLDLDPATVSDARAIPIHARADQRPPAPLSMIATSTGDLASIERLWQVIEERSDQILGAPDGPTVHEAERVALLDCRTALHVSLQSADLLLRAEELRTASRALAGLLGLDATEAMLDALFARFCVGK